MKVLGDPKMTVVGFTSTGPINIYVLNDILRQTYGWNLNVLQSPPALHFCITMNSHSQTSTFLSNVQEAVDTLLNMDEKKRLELEKSGGAAMYGTAAKVPEDSGVMEKVMDGFLDTGTKVGKR